MKDFSTYLKVNTALCKLIGVTDIGSVAKVVITLSPEQLPTVAVTRYLDELHQPATPVVYELNLKDCAG